MSAALDLPDTDSVLPVLTAVSTQLEGLREAELWRHDDTQTVAALDAAYSVVAKAHAVALRLVGDAARRSIACDAGATSMQAWLSARYRLRPAEAKRDLELAQLVSPHHHTLGWVDPYGGADDAHQPGEGTAVSDALWSGNLTVDQARVIGHALTELPPDTSTDHRALAEQILVDSAADHDPATLTRLGHRILEAVDPDTADRHLATILEREARQAERLRSATRHSDGHGNVYYKLRVPLAEDACLWPVLDTLAAPLPTTDGIRDDRAPCQRMADAFLEAFRRVSLDGGLPSAGGDRPRALITFSLNLLQSGLGAATLLDTGDHLAPSAARHLACDADLIPAVLDTTSATVDLGRTARCFTGAARLTIIARDQGCIHPGCQRPPRWCDVHHVTPWWQGGTTKPDNGVLLCGYHHKLHEHSEWHIRFAPDGIPECIPPPWISPHGKPIRHTRHLTRRM